MVLTDEPAGGVEHLVGHRPVVDRDRVAVDDLDLSIGKGEILGLIESGDMKALAYSGQKTPASLGDIPPMRSRSFLAVGDGILVVAGSRDACSYDGTMWSVIIPTAA